jgi:hypothetical protein
MKKLLIISLTIFISTTLFAQKGGYSKGNKLLNIGVGVNSYYSSGFPLGASFEVGITDEISVGANIDYLSSKYDYGYGYSDKFTATYFGARGSYHFNEILNIDNDKIDLYAGVTLGFRSFKYKSSSSGYTYYTSGSYGSGVYFGAFAGGKYYFTDKVAAFAELGAIGSTNVRLGVAFKF